MAAATLKDTDIPTLEGWVNLTEAAMMIGITREHAYKKAATGGFSSVHRVGRSPAYVVSVDEIATIMAEREAKIAAREAKIAARSARVAGMKDQPAPIGAPAAAAQSRFCIER